RRRLRVARSGCRSSCAVRPPGIVRSAPGPLGDESIRAGRAAIPLLRVLGGLAGAAELLAGLLDLRQVRRVGIERDVPLERLERDRILSRADGGVVDEVLGVRALRLQLRGLLVIRQRLRVRADRLLVVRLRLAGGGLLVVLLDRVRAELRAERACRRQRLSRIVGRGGGLRRLVLARERAGLLLLDAAEL